jgi:hypothetical protein
VGVVRPERAWTAAAAVVPGGSCLDKETAALALVGAGVLILLVIIGILTTPDDEPANESSAEPQCEEANPRFVTLMNEQLRNGTEPFESMVFEEVDVSEVPCSSARRASTLGLLLVMLLAESQLYG